MPSRASISGVHPVVCLDDGGALAIAEARRCCSPIGWRLRQEVYLILRQWKVIGYSLFHVFYVTMHIFLNLAYYRYEAGPRLRDVGFEIVPPLSASNEALAEIPLLLIILITLVSLLWSLYDSAPADKEAKPYIFNMGKRFVSCFATGHTLRAATYLATVVPGAGEHCLPGSEWNVTQPKDFYEILARQASPTLNCGDLIFSGHMLSILLLSACLFRYGHLIWRTSARATIAMRALCVLLCSTQAILILAARHHYSVDVVVALYTVPLLWSWWGHAFPHDLAPDDARIAAFVLGRDRERHRERLNGANHSHTSHSLSPELPEHVTNHVL